MQKYQAELWIEIERDFYLNKLIQRQQNGLIKVITGIRRCGKSYLLFKLFKNYLVQNGIDESHIIEIQFDDFAFRQYRKAEAAYDGLIVNGCDHYRVFHSHNEFARGKIHVNGMENAQTSGLPGALPSAGLRNSTVAHPTGSWCT